MMTALVVTSTVGGIAYSLGHGQGRSQSQGESQSLDQALNNELPLLQQPLPQQPSTQVLHEVDSSNLTQLDSQEQSSLCKVSDSSLLKAPGQSLAVSETTRLAKMNIVAELIQDLQSPDPSKRRKAIWDLGQQGDSRAVQPMVDLMMNSDSSQRSLILAAVSEIGIKTLKPMNRALMLSLQDGSPDVRRNGIRDMTRIYDLVGQMSQLLQHAASDPDREVQETANWALTQLNRIRPSDRHDSHCLPGRLSFKELEPVEEKVQG